MVSRGFSRISLYKFDPPAGGCLLPLAVFATLIGAPLASLQADTFGNTSALPRRRSVPAQLPAIAQQYHRMPATSAFEELG